jgi:hypothetical protein
MLIFSLVLLCESMIFSLVAPVGEEFKACNSKAIKQ